MVSSRSRLGQVRFGQFGVPRRYGGRPATPTSARNSRPESGVLGELLRRELVACGGDQQEVAGRRRRTRRSWCAAPARRPWRAAHRRVEAADLARAPRSATQRLPSASTHSPSGKPSVKRSSSCALAARLRSRRRTTADQTMPGIDVDAVQHGAVGRPGQAVGEGQVVVEDGDGPVVVPAVRGTPTPVRSSSARLPTRNRPAGSHAPSLSRSACRPATTPQQSTSGPSGLDAVQIAAAGDEEISATPGHDGADGLVDLERWTSSTTVSSDETPRVKTRPARCRPRARAHEPRPTPVPRPGRTPSRGRLGRDALHDAACGDERRDDRSGSRAAPSTSRRERGAVVERADADRARSGRSAR